MDISITHPKAEDNFQIIKLLISDFRQRDNEDLKEGNYFKRWNENFQKMLNSDFAKVYVAKSETDVIGVSTIYLLPRLELAGEYAVVEDVFVHEGFRSKGIGTKLFEHIIKDLKDSPVKYLGLIVDKENNKAQKFYEELGFRSKSIGMVYDLIDSDEWFHG